MTAYKMLRVPRHEVLRIRELDIYLTRWGPKTADGAGPVFLLHGWQDTGDTFQFMVDQFRRDWPLVAFDWRGFGRSEWPQEGYWFPDYLADLDALLDRLAPNVPVRLIGHSMGANVATLYAGIRPERVRSVVNLEGFGMARTSPADAPARYRKWLDQIKSLPPLKDYESFDQLARIIRFRYPRFTAAQADFVATAWARLDPDGRVRLFGDSRHRWVNPILYKREDAEACWRQMRAPLLMLVGEESEFVSNLGADGSDEAFHLAFPHIELARIKGAGHMLHIEKPELVAPVVEQFLSAH